jgi:hypothetical protein
MEASLVAMVLLFGAGSIRPEEQAWRKAMAECAAWTEAPARLECFDSLARGVASLAPEPEKASPPPPLFEAGAAPGQWRVDVFADPFDDSKTVGLSLVGAEQKAQLVLKCKQRKLDVFINWGQYLAFEAIPVLSRVGAAQAETKKWPVSSDRRSAFFPGDKRAFVQQLLVADRLLAQVTPMGEGAITDVFDLRGLPAVVAPLKETCALP